MEVLDQNGGVLWEATTKGHISLGSAPSSDKAVASSRTASTVRSRPINHGGRALMLSPAGAPSLVLEANEAGARDALPVYPASATNELTQKWIFDRKQAGLFAIRPAFDRSLALTVTNGSFVDGAKVILAVDHGYSNQIWSLVKIGDKYLVLRPMCAPNLVLDNAGGPHSQVDILRYAPGNLNTLWIVRSVSM
jgi:hypothetical protein